MQEQVSLIYQLYLIFVDSFLSGLILPVQNEYLVKAFVMNNSGVFPALLVSFLGSVIGLYINYWIGFYFHYLSVKKNSSLVNGTTYKRMRGAVNNFFFVFLLLSSYNAVGTMLPLIAGIVKYDYKKTLLLIALGKVAMLVLLVV